MAKTIISDWLSKADDDFGFATACLQDEIEYFPHICFHYQQSAEKYLKSFALANNRPLRKIHNLLVLLDECVAVDPSFHDLRDCCIVLNRYYVDTRYPVHWPNQFIKQDAEDAQKAADQIRYRVINQLRNK